MTSKHMVTKALTALDWYQAVKLVQQIYVGGSFTTSEAASGQMTREILGPAGELLLAKEVGSKVVLGATLFLHSPELSSNLQGTASMNSGFWPWLSKLATRDRVNCLYKRVSIMEVTA
ncbi:MAG: hypothetical protein IPH05_02575 [Flavobacteriales bacterium]|jgi:hypothetical protein|nr:hypothetical protein [Flavobacteriales bacterium]MBK6550004.1 hypothetical protein [Flavobacteriales bacterium]MBK6881833.1 hypothetical protein [Flavobacteriales bacterium]MBK7102514.1 hypothetical protein [Flavobacteriales bacterium]MBK7113248.1 hypothetical protein [Flavobacteriales bacterium]